MCMVPNAYINNMRDCNLILLPHFHFFSIMGRKFFFLLVLEFFLVPSTENPIFGYKLVLVWPNTFCQNTQCSSPIPQQFTIHGLWGYDSNSHIVVNCDNGPAFDRSLLNSIEKQLKVDMPGLDRDDEIHWRHQWNKHGKCSGLSVFEYFEEILTLKQQIDIDKSLFDKGIKPSFSDFYSAQKIAKAIDRGTYYVPQLECNQDPSGAKQLFQVFFCLDKSMKLTDCYKKIIKNQSGYVAPSCSIPSSSVSTRTDQVRFPPPPPRSPSPAVHDEF